MTRIYTPQKHFDTNIGTYSRNKMKIFALSTVNTMADDDLLMWRAMAGFLAKIP